DDPADHLVEPEKAMLVRNVTKGAVEAVGPAVVAAHERLLAARARCDLCPAVAAGVAECTHPAVVAAHGENRHASRLPREVRSVLRQGRRGTEHSRETAEELELCRQPRLRQIVHDGLAPARLADV